MEINRNNIYRIAEFTVLFFGVPVLLYYGSFIPHPSLVLLPVLAALIIYFWRKDNFSFKSLIRLNVPKKVIWRNIGVIFLIALVLAAIVVVFEPKKLFNLPREHTEIWLFLGATYPLLSAYPQEIIYRTFLFNRYSKFLKKRSVFILASGVTFSFAHIVYYSPVSMILTLFAGLYLAYIYEKTRSVLFTTILHSVYGMLVFTVGLGHYFWLNMEQYLN